MSGLVIYNTLARGKQTFEPIEPGRVRMYVCGMTVYDYCHLGHARVLVAFDVITRYLRARGYDVDYVRNITDVDDKILKRAVENGESPEALTARFIDAMHEDERALGVLPPDHEPRATQHMADIVAMVQTLIDRGYAYRADNGDVYYSVAKFPDYGKLSGKNPDELLAGARVEIDEHKRDPRDFALWKAAGPDEAVQWPSPWGPGRPGWHIECSAMSKSCLGEHFDIHGGGPDLRFPHHENEIAQSEAANGCAFVDYWMHAGAVRVDGEKMSKSLGNFFTIREILEKYHPEVVRYLLIASHYRSAINYSQENLETARAALERFYIALRGVDVGERRPLTELGDDDYGRRFIAAMDDDFNTPEALAVLFDLARDLNSARGRGDMDRVHGLAGLLSSLAEVLGLGQVDPEAFLQSGGKATTSALSNEAIEELIAERARSKQTRDYARADAIRAELAEQGVVLEDSREGTTWRRE